LQRRHIGAGLGERGLLLGDDLGGIFLGGLLQLSLRVAGIRRRAGFAQPRSVGIHAGSGGLGFGIGGVRVERSIFRRDRIGGGLIGIDWRGGGGRIGRCDGLTGLGEGTWFRLGDKDIAIFNDLRNDIANPWSAPARVGALSRAPSAVTSSV